MIKQAFLNLKRYSSITMDIVVLLVLILFFIGCSYLVKINLDNLANNLQQKVEIAVFLKDHIDLNQAENRIKTIIGKNLKGISFVDKNTALNELKADENLKNEINTLDVNPIKNHFVLKLNGIDEVVLVESIKKLKDLNFVLDVISGENVVKNLNIFLGYVVKIYFVFMFFLVLIFVFLLNYSIKIYSNYRRKEFVLWQYLGVKKNFMISTILLESIFIGFISTIFAVLILYFFYFISANFLFNLIFFSPVFFVVLLICAIIISATINLIVLLKSENQNVKNISY